jgi:uncharacterized protein YraI
MTPLTGVKRVTPMRIAASLIFLAVLISMLLFFPGSSPALAEGPRLVLAFYYAWYDMNTWASGLPAHQPREAYVSADPGTIERHVRQAQAAGIDALVQSWYGPQEANNQTESNFRTLLDIAAASGFHAAVDFETSGPFFPDRASVVEGLRYLLSKHAQHPGYLRYQGKPVIFFWRQQRFGADEWADIRNQVDPDHGSLWIAEGVDIAYQSVFDGHHLYSVAWSPDVGRSLADWGFRVHQYAAQHNVNRLWVATVMPGYDDTRTDRTDKFAVSRRGGDYYREAWAAATATQPDWIVITSFNEWVEGTMIEPSTSYGDLYLNLTHELATAFKSTPGDPATETQNAEPARQLVQATSLESDPPESREIRDSLQAEPYIRAEEAVRVRAGPGTNYDRVGLLTPGETAPVVGKNADASWWQIEYAGAENGLGWVTAEFVTFVGDPASVPVVGQAPATATPASTSAPSPTRAANPTPRPTPAVSASATPAPSATGAATSTSSPTATPESSATPSPTPLPAGSPTLTPIPTHTPSIRTTPAVQRRPVGLLWIGIAALVLAIGLGTVLVRNILR